MSPFPAHTHNRDKENTLFPGQDPVGVSVGVSVVADMIWSNLQGYTIWTNLHSWLDFDYLELIFKIKQDK